MNELWNIMEKNDYLKYVPEKFHSNHPGYSKWITQKLNESRINGRLTPDSVKKVIEEAKVEINNAIQHWERTGENMNTYFNSLLQK